MRVVMVVMMVLLARLVLSDFQLLVEWALHFRSVPASHFHQAQQALVEVITAEH